MRFVLVEKRADVAVAARTSVGVAGRIEVTESQKVLGAICATLQEPLTTASESQVMSADVLQRALAAPTDCKSAERNKSYDEIPTAALSARVIS